MPNRIEQIRNELGSSITRTQFNNRKEIYDRLVNIIKISKNENDFYFNTLKDFPVWTVWHFDNEFGNPIFLAKWQIEFAELLDKHRRVMGLTARKIGKSTIMALKSLHKACSQPNFQMNCYAPTHGQDFIYRDIRRFLNQNKFINSKYLNGENAMNTATRIYLDNGSLFNNHTIGLSTKGELTLGERGNVLVDEIELIEKPIITGIINPMLSTTYADLVLWLVGTPKLDANPDLEEMFNSWRNDPTCATFSMDWKRGVQEGTLKYEEVLRQYREMTPDEFLMMYCAKFPEQSSKFFPMSLLWSCGENYEFSQSLSNKQTVMAVDWAKKIDKTQILIGEIDGDILRYRYWQEIDPQRGVVDYDYQIELVKQLFHSFNCTTIIPDATGAQDKLAKDLTEGNMPINETYIYKNQKNSLGYIATGEGNYEMWRSHKRMMVQNRIRVPKVEPFWTKWRKEHNELITKSAHGGRYLFLDAPSNGSKDLAFCSAMLSLLTEPQTAIGSLEIVTW